jgi:hypothetical protein
MVQDAGAGEGFDLTTKGQIHTHSASGQAGLNVGSNNEILTADSTTTTGLKWASASSGSGKWEKLDYVTQTSAGNELQTTTFTPKDYLRVIIWNPKGSGTRAVVMRFGTSGNIDSGSNYKYIRFNSGTYETNSSASDMLLQPTTTVNSSFYSVVDIMNLDGERTSFVANSSAEEYVGGGTSAGGWSNTNQVDIILINASIHGGTDSQIDSGAFIEVWGCDKDA